MGGEPHGGAARLDCAGLNRRGYREGFQLVLRDVRPYHCLNMTAAQARLVLQANAVFDLAAGLLLLTGTWDGLWDALDLPQGRPALFVQVGGAGLLGFAYVLWRAADEPPLRAPVALAAAGADGLAALVVLVWLVTGELPDDVDALGTILLIALAVVLAAFAVLKAGIARGRREGEEEFGGPRPRLTWTPA